MLTELEAYHQDEPAAHSYGGRPTPRTEGLFGPPGTAYVYFTYGMHWCANIVCAREGECEAVLLRAGEPVAGIDLMRKLRTGITNDRLLAAGPARLCKAMGIDKRHNGAGLLRGGRFWCAEDADTAEYRKKEISQTVRVGLGPGRGDEIPWRFVVPGHPHASRPR